MLHSCKKSRTHHGIRFVSACLVAVAIIAATRQSVHADSSSCSGSLDFTYKSVASPNTLNSIDRVKLVIGANTITGGTLNQLTVTKVFFDLDCTQASLPNCVDDGAVVGYVGNISTTCSGTAITTNVLGTDPHTPGATMPNEVDFTFTPGLVIPSNTSAFCELEFDVQIRSQTSNDTTPQLVEQRAGIASASCDNSALFAATVSAGSVGLSEPPPKCRGVTCVIRKRPKRCQ